jgi:hypothetical protein
VRVVVSVVRQSSNGVVQLYGGSLLQMKIKGIFNLASSFAVGCVLMTASANATTIGSLVQLNGGGTQDYTITDGGTFDTLTASSQVGFQFSSSLTPPPFGGVSRNATLTITSQSNLAATNSGTIDQVGYVGTFTIIDNILHTNLLSGTFNNGDLSSPIGGHSATFSDSLPPDSVTFTSDYLNFSLSTNEAFAFSLTNVLPSLTAGGSPSFIHTATAAGSGVFSAAPIPQGSPEPATMALFGAGLTGIAVLLRRRKV